MAAFEIDGRDYPVPSVLQLTMGEAQVLYDYCGLTLEDFVPPPPDQPDDKRLGHIRNPAFKRAMVHIAYQRGNPETGREEVAAIVNNVQMFDMAVAFYADDDEDPTPVSPNEPPNTKPTSVPTGSESSGRRSDSNSGLPDGIRAPIGTTG